MADGYGFGAEGDWKTAALVRAMKVMSHGLKSGTSFMEDYTYHLTNGGQVLGAHMLEVCPSIAEGTPTAEIHPLSIFYRGQSRSGVLGIYGLQRKRAECFSCGSGEPLSLDRQSGELGAAGAPSTQATRGPGDLDTGT
jgi:L-arabinose isomerase